MQEADVLLLVSAVASRDALTGKLFEYIAAQRPILALVMPGRLSQFVEVEGLGIAIPADDCQAIKSALLKLHEKHKAGRLVLVPNADLLARFDRRHLTSRLATILEDVVQRTGS
jgi:hypothetical protein